MIISGVPAETPFSYRLTNRKINTMMCFTVTTLPILAIAITAAIICQVPSLKVGEGMQEFMIILAACTSSLSFLTASAVTVFISARDTSE